MLSAVGYSPRFKAVGSWDYKNLEPIIFKILTDLHYPTLVSDTAIEDTLKKHDLPDVIGEVRLRHCISRALKAAGYVKRSLRGHAWDWNESICAADMHVKKPSLFHRVKRAVLDLTGQTTIDMWL